MAFNVQGSITVKRLRSGSTITLYATTNNPLQQFVTEDSGVVTPDWTVEANQPTITPQAVSSGGTVTLSDGAWYYNTILLVFDGSSGTTADGWVINNSSNEDVDKHFALNTETFALRIIDNLASKENYANDTLEFDVLCHFEGNEYPMSWTTDIVILKTGTSAYNAMLWADTQTLTASVPSTVLHAQLLSGEGYVSGFYTKWYKNYVSDTPFAEIPTTSNTADLTVGIDDVNGGDNNDNTGGTLFICQYYKEQTDTSPIAVAGISIADESDEYSLIFTITSDNKQVDTDRPVTLQASVYSAALGRAMREDEFEDISYTLTVLNADLTPSEHVENSDTIEITSADIYDDNDVNVVGEAEFTVKY